MNSNLIEELEVLSSIYNDSISYHISSSSSLPLPLPSSTDINILLPPLPSQSSPSLTAAQPPPPPSPPLSSSDIIVTLYININYDKTDTKICTLKFTITNDYPSSSLSSLPDIHISWYNSNYNNNDDKEKILNNARSHMIDMMGENLLFSTIEMIRLILYLLSLSLLLLLLP